MRIGSIGSLRPDLQSLAKIFLKLEKSTSAVPTLQDILSVRQDCKPQGDHGYFFTGGPLKPSAFLAFLVDSARRAVHLRAPAKLIVLIDGVGFYVDAAWRRARVIEERRLQGTAKLIFSLIWWIRRFLVRGLECCGIARQVDVWFEMKKSGLVIQQRSQSGPRIWIGQPLVEHFELDENQAALLQDAALSSQPDAYLPHPRSTRHLPIPRLRGRDDEPAELALLRVDGYPVGFCSSTLYNLMMLGCDVEFVSVPPSLHEVLRHREKLDEAHERREQILLGKPS